MKGRQGYFMIETGKFWNKKNNCLSICSNLVDCKIFIHVYTKKYVSATRWNLLEKLAQSLLFTVYCKHILRKLMIKINVKNVKRWVMVPSYNRQIACWKIEGMRVLDDSVCLSCYFTTQSHQIFRVQLKTQVGSGNLKHTLFFGQKLKTIRRLMNSTCFHH